MRSLKILNLVCFVSIVWTGMSCDQSSKKSDQIVNAIEKSNVVIDTSKSPMYNFEWPLASVQKNKDTKLYLPFYKNSKYFIADSKGKQVSSGRYEKIYRDTDYPFYWAKKSDKYYLFTYPEEQVIKDGFEKPQDIEFARSRISMVDNVGSSHVYYTLIPDVQDIYFQSTVGMLVYPILFLVQKRMKLIATT